MEKNALRTIIRNAKGLHDMLEDDENLPEHVQAAIVRAEQEIVGARDYIESEKEINESANNLSDDEEKLIKKIKDLTKSKAIYRDGASPISYKEFNSDEQRLFKNLEKKGLVKLSKQRSVAGHIQPYKGISLLK